VQAGVKQALVQQAPPPMNTAHCRTSPSCPITCQGKVHPRSARTSERKFPYRALALLQSQHNRCPIQSCRSSVLPMLANAYCEECQHKEHKIAHKHGATTSQPTHDDFHECGFSLDSRRSAHLLLRRPHAMSQEVEPVRVQSMASAMAVVNNRPASTFRSACTRCCAFSSSLSSLP